MMDGLTLIDLSRFDFVDDGWHLSVQDRFMK